MDLERIASVYPHIMTDILSECNFEDLLLVRGVSTTLYQFLMKDRQVWIQIFTKIYSNMLVNNDDARFPLKLMAPFETKEAMKIHLKSQWRDVFNKIKGQSISE